MQMQKPGGVQLLLEAMLWSRNIKGSENWHIEGLHLRKRTFFCLKAFGISGHENERGGGP